MDSNTDSYSGGLNIILDKPTVLQEVSGNNEDENQDQIFNDQPDQVFDTKDDIEGYSPSPSFNDQSLDFENNDHSFDSNEKDYSIGMIENGENKNLVSKKTTPTKYIQSKPKPTFSYRINKDPFMNEYFKSLNDQSFPSEIMRLSSQYTKDFLSMPPAWLAGAD